MREPRPNTLTKQAKWLIAIVCLLVVGVAAIILLPRFTYKTAEYVNKGGYVADFDGIGLKYNNYGIKLTNASSDVWSNCTFITINEKYKYTDVTTVNPHTTLSIPYDKFATVNYTRLDTKLSKPSIFHILCNGVNGDSRSTTYQLN